SLPVHNLPGLHELTSTAGAAASAKGIAAKDITKSAKDIFKAHIFKAGSAASAAETSVNALMTELIISLSLLIIAKHFIGFRSFFKLALSFRILRIPVGVKLHGPFSVGLLYF